MNHYLLIAASVAGSLLLAACSNTPDQQKAESRAAMESVQDKMNETAASAKTPAAWESERTEILNDLRGIRDNIDGKLATCNERLAGKDLKPSQRNDEEMMKSELIREKTQVETLISNVEGATDNTWTSVKADTKTASDEVEGWWARVKDNVDKKTDSDKDNDGH